MGLGASVPPGGSGGAAQSPWTADEDAAGHDLTDVGHLIMGGAAPSLTVKSASLLTGAGNTDVFSGADGSMVIQLSTNASDPPIPAGTQLVEILYGKSWPSNPSVICVGGLTAVSVGVGWYALGTKALFTDFTSGFYLYSSGILAAGQQYFITCLSIGG